MVSVAWLIVELDGAQLDNGQHVGINLAWFVLEIAVGGPQEA